MTRRNFTKAVAAGLAAQLTPLLQSQRSRQLKIGLSTPGHASIVGQTDAGGIIDSDGASAWAPLAAGSAIGTYDLKMTAADNPALVKGGKLMLTPIVNIGLILGYNFTPKA